MSIWQGYVAYSFLVLKGKTFNTQERELQQAEAWGPWEQGIVDAAPAQTNYLIRLPYLDIHLA